MNADISTRNTLSLVLEAAVVSSSIAALGLTNHRRLRMVAGWKYLHFRECLDVVTLDSPASTGGSVVSAAKVYNYEIYIMKY